jgi:hypothetical protein
VDPADPDNAAGIKMKLAKITITVTHSPL